ncbi:hypothetical protein [Nocardia brasiliensis]|uniref:Uncharacterized protein n=1 Tax=Nocardia brasiliensis (strain ATCC 700358 / HUJEG-1) TaxID=1133849 RepID=K0F403_NOCB7|nr:hypothetical protein [Nocardia brasiliensis]AFU02296.1 hypothetical protein O3I_021685 [Nocardia brasiliensis ATCC 700358]
MDNEPGKAAVDMDQLIQLFTGVLQQYRQQESAAPSTLAEGNDFTLSIFSELQYGLQSRNLSAKGPIDQRLPALVDVEHKLLEFQKGLPSYADRIAVIHRGARGPEILYVYDEIRRDGGNGDGCGSNPTFAITYPAEAVAAQIQDCKGKVRAVTFVTYGPVSSGSGGGVSLTHSDSPQAL